MCCLPLFGGEWRGRFALNKVRGADLAADKKLASRHPPSTCKGHLCFSSVCILKRDFLARGFCRLFFAARFLHLGQDNKNNSHIYMLCYHMRTAVVCRVL